jgi:antitoxin (DNA-binding transcriptional repressor) of toxin-antitoxin stability system
MQVTLQYATEHLDELASAADNGEDVEIARPEKPALKLVVSANVPRSETKGRRILGALRGQIVVPSEEEWRKMDEELADHVTNGSIFPSE